MKVLNLIIIVSILLLVILAVVLFLVQQKTNQIEGWQNYRNRYGYQIQYPENWRLDKGDQEQVVILSNDVVYGNYENSCSIAIELLSSNIEEVGTLEAQGYNKTIINKDDFIIYRFEKEKNNKPIVIFFVKEGKVVRFSYAIKYDAIVREECDSVLNQVVNFFSFTK